MFDIGAAELLMIVVVAIVVIGPKDLPLAMRTAGRWIGRLRKMSAHFRSGLDAMVRESELEDMEAQWKKQNAKIMRDYPDGPPPEMEPTGAYPPKPGKPIAPPEAPAAKDATATPQPVEAETAADPSPAAPVPPENPDPAGAVDAGNPEAGAAATGAVKG